MKGRFKDFARVRLKPVIPRYRPEITHETIQAAIRAYAEGKIELGSVSRDTPQGRLRYAPSFTLGERSVPGTERPYTAEQLSKFLGYRPEGVQEALRALELIEQKFLKPGDFKNVGPKKAELLTRLVSQAKKDHEDPSVAQRVAQAVANVVKQEDLGVREATRLAQDTYEKIVVSARESKKSQRGQGTKEVR